jgi:hypothetical protein
MAGASSLALLYLDTEAFFAVISGSGTKSKRAFTRIITHSSKINVYLLNLINLNCLTNPGSGITDEVSRSEA